MDRCVLKNIVMPFAGTFSDLIKLSSFFTEGMAFVLLCSILMYYLRPRNEERSEFKSLRATMYLATMMLTGQVSQLLQQKALQIGLHFVRFRSCFKKIILRL